MSRLRTIAQALAGPASLLLIVIGLFWKLVLVSQYSWIEAPDIANQVIPWFNYQAQQFHLHNIPIWDPYLFGGQSLIGQGQPGLAYPLNWILFALPLHNGHINFDIVNWYFVSIHYLAALFCYLLCRDLGRSKLASVLAGVSFGLGGYVGGTDWPQMINGAIWGPLVFLFLFRVVRGVRPVASAAFSGVFLGVSWLSGHHQIPVFLTLAAGAVWLYFLLEPGRWNRSWFTPVAVFLLFFVCAGALQILPAYEYGHLASRWVGSQHDPITWKQPVPYYVHQQYSLGPIYLLGILIPGYWTDTNPYAGVIALAIAGLALACFWKTKEVRVLFGVGAAGLFLALAKNDVFQGILYSVVPFFEKVRSPGSAIYLFQFAIAVLLGFGLDALFLPATQSLLRRLTRVLLGFGLLVALIVFAIDLGHALKWEFDDRVMMCPLLALALAGLVYRSSRGDSRRWLSVLLIGLYMVDLGNLLFFNLPSKDDNRAVHLRSFDATKEIAKFLKQQPQPVRSEISRADVEFNFSDWYGMDAMTGILPSLPTSLCNLDFVSPRAKALYGTNFTVSRNPTMAGQQAVFRDSFGLTVFRNPGVLPRVWTVHQGVQIKTAREARTLMQDSSFDLQKQTFGYASMPPMDQCEGDTVREFDRGTNFTTAVVNMTCRGMLIQSENSAPGWVATVDGKNASIYEAYTAVRGVVVGPGTHTVEMNYRPLSVFAGAAATVLAFMGAIAMALVPRFRGSPPQMHADARK